MILKEISKRTNIPVPYLKYLSPREVSTIFKETPSIKELKKRKENCVYYWDINGMECIFDKETDSIKKEILVTLFSCFGKSSDAVELNVGK